jgi:hypothetical protein
MGSLLPRVLLYAGAMDRCANIIGCLQAVPSHHLEKGCHDLCFMTAGNGRKRSVRSHTI